MTEAVADPIGTESDAPKAGEVVPDCNAIAQTITRLCTGQGIQVRNLGVILRDHTVHVTGTVRSYVAKKLVLDTAATFMLDGFIQDNQITIA
jgi:hypothetical protein